MANDGAHGHPQYDAVLADHEARLAALESAKPVPPQPPSGNVKVARTVPEMKSFLADNAVDRVQIGGRMPFTPGYPGPADTLWFAGQTAGAGHNIAARTRPAIIEAVSPVVFDGGGKSGLGGLVFMEGVHDLHFMGQFTIDNLIPASAGALGFGGADVNPAYRIPAHHIAIDDLTIAKGVHRSSASNNLDHAAYFSNAHGDGPHDIEIGKLTIDGTDALCVVGGIHCYHGNGTNKPSHHVTIRQLLIKGCISPIIMWYDETGADAPGWLIDGGTIESPNATYGVRFEDSKGSVSAGAITLKNLTVTAKDRFYSTLGERPKQVVFSGGNLP